MQIKTLFLVGVCAFALNAQTSLAKMYARGDVGMAIPFALDTDSVYGGTTNAKPNTGFLYNFGAGYQFFPMLRAEVSLKTIEPLKLNATGTALFPTQDAAGKPGDPVKKDTTNVQKIGGKAAMASLYYDVGDFGGMTPYVGAGVGVAMNNPSDLVVSTTDNDLLIYPGVSSSNVAWDVGAGVSYQVDDKTMVDFGYKFTYFGKLTVGTPVNAKLADGTIDKSGKYKAYEATKPLSSNFKIHAVNLGLRVTF